jgi:Uma2 family endonuclease
MDVGAFSDMRVELVRGTLRKTALNDLAHGELHAKLAGALASDFVQSGFRLAIGLAIEIDSATVRGADIAVARPDVPERGLVPPDYVVMAVEIAATTLAEDIGEKLADYARAGIPDYWVADLGAEVMHVMRKPEGDSYAERSVVPFDQPLAVLGTDRTIVVGEL